MKYQKIIEQLGIAALNEMQEKTIAAINSQNEVQLISPTGSGKTLAFLLPLLHLLQSDIQGVQAIVIVPSRELALQIEQVFKQLKSNFKVNCCYGGHSVRIEKNSLQPPPALLIGTPGRIAYHIRNENVITNSIKILILDEFDKSLEFGFKEDMAFIISQLRELKKRVLTSATSLKEIPSFVGINKCTVLDFSNQYEDSRQSLQLKIVRVAGDDKLDAFILLISKLENQSKIVFCNHRDAVNRIAERLQELKIAHGLYHGGMDQIDRERSLIKFRNGSNDLLITTDLGARGLDIPEIEAVIHYQLPTTEESMIHRNGRTARMHATGTAYLLLDKKDYVPKYISDTPEEEALPNIFKAPSPTPWKTLYIAAGKKDNINKTDIVGLLLKKGGLEKDELGKVEVLDNSAYAAVKTDKIKKVLTLIKQEKIKNKKVKFEISE
jgi:superfamily II DNA/RNA helicase